MKKLLFALSVLLISSFSFGQTWSALGNGMYGDGRLGSVDVLSIYNNSLIAGGEFDSAGNTPANFIASWNGGKWSSIGSGVNDEIFALCVYKGDLYAGGEFDTAGGKYANCIAKWNGSIWSPVGLGVSGGNYGSGVYAMNVYNGNLFVGGHFDTAGGIPAKNIAQWNGITWDSVPGGVGRDDIYSWVEAFGVYNGNLIVCGSFTEAGIITTNNVAQWNGSNWSGLGTGTDFDGQVDAVSDYNGNFIMGGNFDSVNGIVANNIAQWNGTKWSPLGVGTDNGIYALDVYNSKLYAGGSFYFAGGNPENRIAQWNGTSWAAVGTGMQGPDSVSVFALLTFDSVLYAGGDFYDAGGVPSYDIAQWAEPLGINELSQNNWLNVFPNPNNGIFTIQSSTLSCQSSVEVYNMLGEKVYSNQFLIPNSQFVINITNQPAGIYLYRVISAEGVQQFSGKFIIEK